MKTQIDVVGAILRRDGKFLLGLRPQGKSQAGKWEFVGGKVEPGETPQKALVRECREELALEIIVGNIRASAVHEYPDKIVNLILIDCEPAPHSEPVSMEHDRICWFSHEELRSIDLSAADAALLQYVLSDAYCPAQK